MSYTIEKQQDNIYLNVIFDHPQPGYPTDPTIPATNIAAIPAEYSVNKTIPIIDKCSDYYCSVVRFDIPLDEVPVYIVPVIPNTGVNGDPDQTIYVIGVFYKGVHYCINVEYLADNTLNPPIQNQKYQVITPYYYCYTYQTLLNAINQALYYVIVQSGYYFTLYPSSYATGTASQSGTTITGSGTTWTSGMVGGYIVYANGDYAKITGFTSTTSITVNVSKTETNQTYTIYYGTAPQSPFFWFDSTTQLFNLVVPTDMINGAISIFINEPLQNLISSFELSYQATGTSNGQPYGADYYFILTQSTPNQLITIDSINYYQFTQEYSTTTQWTSLRKILVTTNTIPVQNEFVPNFNTNDSQNGVSSSFPIITDFIPQIEPVNAAANNRSIAYYIPTSQYRLVDMIGDSPLNKVNLKVFWQDKSGNLYPVMISCTQQGSIKIGFFRKSLYKPMNMLIAK